MENNGTAADYQNRQLLDFQRDENKRLKEEHSTKMLLENMKFDTGLENKLFTQRYLKRSK